MNDKTAIPPLHTVCVGRYLVDLPDELQLRGDLELYYGLDKEFKTMKVEVLRAKGSVPSFKTIVAERAAALAKEANDDVPSKNMLNSQRAVDEDTVLIRANTEVSDQGYFKALVIFQKGDAIGLVTADILKGDTPEVVEAKALAIAQRIGFVADPLGEAGKGTCIGPLRVDAQQDGEVLILGTRGTSHQDMSMRLTINSMIAKSDGGLLKRVAEKAGMLEKLGVLTTTLRRGKVVIAGRPGEELLDAGAERGKAVRVFAAETVLNKPSTFAEPLLHLSLNTGGQLPVSAEYVDASLSEKENLALWDAIIKSIRLRPGAV